MKAECIKQKYESCPWHSAHPVFDPEWIFCTKYMICGTKKKHVENVFKVKHMTFERVNSFVYLGILITTDNNTSAEINNRIALANRSYFALVNILRAKT